MAPEVAAAATQAPGGTRRSSPPFSAVLGAAVGALLLFVAIKPFRDPDLWWHLIAGQQLAAGIPPWELGADWSFAADSATTWVSTQWLAEWLLHMLNEIGQWTSLAWFRALTTFVSISILAATTLRHRPVALAGFPFALATLALFVSAQVRPLQITYVGAAALSGVLLVGLREGRTPRWWIPLPGTCIWANLHGGWVLAPAILVLVASGRVLDHGWADAAARRFLLLGLAAGLSGAVTPAGVQNITAVLRVSRAASEAIIEWQPTTPMSAGGYVSFVMLGLILLGWSRSARIPSSEVVATLALLAFAWSAWRNLTPALLLLAPLVAQRLSEAFPNVGARDEPPWSVPLGISLAIGLTCVGLVAANRAPLLPTQRLPIDLAAGLTRLPPEQRVLNAYNVAGVILYFGPAGTRVAIDGRTDRYGEEFIDSYLSMQHLSGDWELMLDQLNPTSAILQEDSALAHVLVSERGWREDGRGAGFVLLSVPSSGVVDAGRVPSG